MRYRCINTPIYENLRATYHDNDGRVLSVVGAKCQPDQRGQQTVSEYGGQVTDVSKMFYERHRSHSPVTA